MTAAPSSNPHGRVARLLRHRWHDQAHVHRLFPPEALQRITQAVAASEQSHTAQLRICIEASLPTSYVWRRLTARDRALTLFGKFRLWDTDQRNGVLLYVLLVEHAIEIVADRGVVAHLSQDELDGVAQGLTRAFRAGQFEQGMADAIAGLTQLLRQAFPRVAGGSLHNELDDAPLVL
ncbi:hypothetical protein CCO03_02435 [Comamonas serinivorans]|uniref:TPM domain-containing protein n=1 Tax=Comamonas serinivorans TaxID=1082851 RepID=A0A1Y0EJD5_9BURK|nr:TPM domain-containing protein [Comamonas serinivorans]ARU03696.1 hypothetical protein CCO03_02435 [Comamonas serinivorans]